MPAPRAMTKALFLEGQHFVYGRSFHIQNFAFQGENGRCPSVPALLARTAGGISFQR